MLDYCCYGACLSRYFIGEQAVAALGMKANLNAQYGDAEDHAIALYRFPSAVGVSEGDFNTPGPIEPSGPIVRGTKGALIVDDIEQRPIVKLVRGHGVVDIIEGDPLLEGRENVAWEVIRHLETGEPLEVTLEMMFNLEVMAILDAGIRSATSGKLEPVDNAAWCIG